MNGTLNSGHHKTILKYCTTLEINLEWNFLSNKANEIIGRQKKKHLPKRKNKAKSSQGKEATAVETDGEYVIMRGAITPKEKYKKDRCKDVIGLTVSKALNTTVENDGGKQVVYTKMDLSNDQKDGFITLTKNRELNHRTRCIR